jgi:transcriptional regulator with XRE-family HTH domain
MAASAGPYIREWREYRGLTLVQLGAITGLHHSSLSKIETGKRRWNAETIHRIAQALSVTPAMLLGMLPPGVGTAIPDIALLWAELTPAQREVMLQIINALRSAT